MYQRKDRFYQRAKTAGYRSRAAYKLIELDRRFGLLHAGDTVVDLGAWPGGWLQVAAERVTKQGVIVGVDRNVIAPIPGVICVNGDLREHETLVAVRARCGGGVDVVLSDMAPQLSGIRTTDEARAAELAGCALRAADALLRPGGRLLVKLFQSEESTRFLGELRQRFGTVKVTRPAATRAGSAEMYAIAIGFQPIRHRADHE